MSFDIFNANIEELSQANSNYRKVIFTSPSDKMQLVLMSLKAKEEIGIEKHNEADQFIRIEKGNGKVQYGNDLNKLSEVALKDGSVVIIPANTWHNIINTDDSELKLYTIYSQPQHKKSLVQVDKPLTQDGGNVSDHLHHQKYLMFKSKYLSQKNQF